MNQPESLFGWMVSYIRQYGQSPTAAEIRTATDFSQPGGIGRLCDALETVGVLMAKSATARAA